MIRNWIAWGCMRGLLSQSGTPIWLSTDSETGDLSDWLAENWAISGRRPGADAGFFERLALFLPAHAVTEALSQFAECDVNFAETVRRQCMGGRGTLVDHVGRRTLEHPDRSWQPLRVEPHAKPEVIAAAEGNVYIMRCHALAGRDLEPEGVFVPLAFPERPRQDDNVPEITFVGLLA